MSFGVVTFLMIVCFILYVVVKLKIQDARYNSIKEITTGKEITVIEEEYVNAHIDSAEWNDNVLECTKADIREGVQVILDREYSSYVCEFMNAYMAGKAYIPENSMSAVTYEPTDPGYFLCLDFNNDGVDEVFVSYYADADAWYMIGNVARLEGTTSTFSHYNQESSCLILMREMLGDAENVIHNSIYFFTGDWHDLNCYEQYEKICVYENQDGVESNIEKNISCMLHKDGVSENISEEIWEKAFNTPMVRLSSNKERIFRITQENVDYYLRVE